MTAPFAIEPADLPILEAAIALGDWIKSQDDTSAIDRAIVESVQEALRRLPEATESVNGEYEVRVVTREDDRKVLRLWSVGITDRTLDIALIHGTEPPSSPWEDDAHELELSLGYDWGPLRDLHCADEWIGGALDPDSLRRGAEEFEIIINAGW